MAKSVSGSCYCGVGRPGTQHLFPMTPIQIKSTPVGNFVYSVYEERYLNMAYAYTSSILASDTALNTPEFAGLKNALIQAPAMFVRGLRSFASVPEFLDQTDLDAFEPDFERFTRVLDEATAGYHTIEWATNALKPQVPDHPLDGMTGLGIVNQWVILGPYLVEGVSPINLSAMSSVVYLRVLGEHAGLIRGHIEQAIKAFTHHPILGYPAGIATAIRAVLPVQFDLFVEQTPIDSYNFAGQGAPMSALACVDLAHYLAQNNSCNGPTAFHDLFSLFDTYAHHHPYVTPSIPDDEEEVEEEEVEEVEEDEEEEEEE